MSLPKKSYLYQNKKLQNLVGDKIHTHAPNQDQIGEKRKPNF